MFCEHCGKKISQGNQFCEFCGKEQGVNNNTTTSSATSSVGSGSMAKWLSYRNLLGFAAVLIAISLFYYFLIRPIQEKRTYEDCFGALTETEQLPYGLQTSEKNFRLDTCVKSRGANEIRVNYVREQERRAEEQAMRDATEKRKAEEELAKQEAKKISYYDYQSIELFVNNYDGRRVSGSIKNDLPYNIQNIVLHVEAFTDKSEKNKVGETECRLGNFVVYANSTKKYSAYCDLEESANWFLYQVTSAEKAL